MIRFTDTAFIKLFYGQKFDFSSPSCCSVYAKSHTILDIQTEVPRPTRVRCGRPTIFW